MRSHGALRCDYDRGSTEREREREMINGEVIATQRRLAMLSLLKRGGGVPHAALFTHKRTHTISQISLSTGIRTLTLWSTMDIHCIALGEETKWGEDNRRTNR